VRSILWTELRRCPIRWWSLPYTAVIVIYLAVGFDRWYAIGSQTATTIQLGAALGTVIIAAGAAWTGVQHSRAGQHDQLVVGSRNPWVRESIPLAAVIVYAVAPVAAAVFATSIINLSWGRAGAVWPSYIWLTLTTVILAVSTGYLLGRLLPSPFTVAAAALTMTIVVFAGTDSDRMALATLYGYPDVRLSGAALAARMALAALVTAIAIGVGAWREWARTKTVSHSVGPAVAVSGIVVATVAVYAAGPLQVERDYVGGAPCTETRPVVCVWYEHERYLPKMERYVERFNELDEFIALPDDPYSGEDEFWETGMRGDVGDQLTFFGGDFGAASSMVHYAMETSGFPGCDIDNDGPGADRVGQLEWNLTDWFTLYIMDVDSTEETGAHAPGLDEIDPILAMPEDEQFEWARQSMAEMREHCVD
jgi:hypothetical protein